MNSVEASQIANLLGVDEVVVDKNSLRCDFTIRVRLGARWMATFVEEIDLLSVRDTSAYLGRIVFDLADALKQQAGIESARAEVLDQLAANVGVARGEKSDRGLREVYAPPEKRQHNNRFEAVVEEMKRFT